METLFEFLCFATSLCQMAALVALVGRYAMSQSPRLLHLILVTPMLASSVALIMLCYVVVSRQETLLLDVAGWTLVFLGAQFAKWLTFLGYALWWELRGRHR